MVNGECTPLGNILLFNKIMLTLNVKIAEFYVE